MLDSVPFTARLRKDITCLRGHIVKLSTQTIHTVCCETPLFFKGKKFKLFNSLFYSVYQSLFSIADLFAVVICGSYLAKINAVLWPSARLTFASLDLFIYARIACPCNFESNKRTWLLYLGKAQIIIIIFFYFQILFLKLFLHIQNSSKSINT